MRALMSLWLCLCTSHAFDPNSAYLPANNEYSHRPLVTEYFSYTAPPEDDQSLPLQAARQLATALAPPQQVVFIRTPETSLFTLTAKQLAASKALDIYVLQRQMDAAALAEQKAAIEQQADHRPTVHFVKYRTPADVTRALSRLRANYDQLPGNSYSHAVETANVIHLNPPQHLAQPDPVVFKILPKDAADYETDEQARELEAAKLQALFRPYLPRAQRR
ncbi:uncharacterized protein TwdlS [Drosophila virilis]|uniref:DUF243 domain-containing protein n=1 Tax=Drosophila virilis TaxID=7244 RepID=B4MC33_DROVI|nr:uncharacterized protein LOC6635043 [Drosophila virilis]EDW58654.1 uncharacterized protein Dvir_GJ14177 [Drosophila virilis]